MTELNPLTKFNVKKQLLLLTVLLLTPVFIMNWFANEKAEDILKRQVTGAYAELVKQNHTLIEREIVTVSKITTTYIQNSITQQMVYNPLHTTLERVRKFDEMNILLSSYSIGVNDGNSVLYSLFIADETKDYFFAPSYRHTKRGVFFIPKEEQPDWYDKALSKRGEGFLKIIDGFGSNSQKTLAYIRAVHHVKGKQEAIGVLVATNMEKKIEEIMNLVSLPEAEMMFLDMDHHFLAGTRHALGEQIELPFDASPGMLNNLQPLEGMDAEFIYVMSSNPIGQHKLAYKIPVKSLVQQQNELRSTIQMISVVYFIVCFMVMMYFFRSLIRPLSRIAVFFKAYEPGKVMPVTPELERKDEVGVLLSAMHGLTHRLNGMIRDKYELEIKQKEAQLQLLYEQINPHLLYNTLESIYWKGSLEGSTESAEMIKDLAKLMKIGLSRGKDVIPFEEELEHAKAYVSLQQKRFDYAFQIKWDIADSARRVMVPKVMLQPILENAIMHGVRSMESEGEISVSAALHDTSQSSKQLIIRIADNGFRKVDIEAIRSVLYGNTSKEGGYGLRNVHWRIQMHFGESYGLELEHGAPQGMVVIIKLPTTGGGIQGTGSTGEGVQNV
ncbi:sensor histidine kinase [Paenibacillaceae bacterium]|nr:sensor histidine kinase [Paenibacillaceae bacterium]